MRHASAATAFVPFAGIPPDLDRELAAIETVARALEALDAPAQERVLAWATQRFGVVDAPPGPTD